MGGYQVAAAQAAVLAIGTIYPGWYSSPTGMSIGVRAWPRARHGQGVAAPVCSI